MLKLDDECLYFDFFLNRFCRETSGLELPVEEICLIGAYVCTICTVRIVLCVFIIHLFNGRYHLAQKIPPKGLISWRMSLSASCAASHLLASIAT